MHCGTASCSSWRLMVSHTGVKTDHEGLRDSVGHPKLLRRKKKNPTFFRKYSLICIVIYLLKLVKVGFCSFSAHLSTYSLCREHLSRDFYARVLCVCVCVGIS